MKRLLLIVLFGTFILRLFSQSTNQFDSLKNILKNTSGQDKIELLLILSSEYHSVDLQKAIEYSKEALQEAEKLNESIQIGRAKKSLGKALLFSGENEEAYKNLNEAQQIFEEHNFESELFDLYYSIGQLYQYESSYEQAKGYFRQALKSLIEGNNEQEASVYQSIGTIFFYESIFDSAIFYYEKSLELKKKIGNNAELANAYNNIGMVYFYWGDYENALSNYFLALDIFKLENNDEGTAHCYNGIANVYFKSDENQKSLDHYLKAADIYEKTGNKKRLANVLNSIGIVYKSESDYEKAIEYQKQSLEIKKEIGNKKGIAASLNGLGISYKKTEQYQKALDYYNQALEIQLEINDAIGAGSTYSNIGMLYTAWGKYMEAIPFYEKAQEMAQEANYSELIINNYEGMAENFEKMGDYQNAFKYFVLYTEVKDSVFTAKKQLQISELQTKYETQEAKQQVFNLTKENQIQQLRIRQKQRQNIALIILLVFIIIIIVLVFIQVRANNKLKSMELEQKLLRSQMNPHFIFNSLIAIQSFIYENKKEDAGKYLSDFSKLMRLILENSKYELISLENELEGIEYYLKLQKLRFDDVFDYNVEVGETLETESLQVPPMLIQPFLENSVEHGMKGLNKKGLISIKINEKGNSLNIELTDNGVGRAESDKSRDSGHKSYGMEITRERLGLLKKNSGLNIDFEIIDLKDDKNQAAGTKIVFNLPIKVR
jgi:tetratricopeptide (TPR) repeat protein